MHAKTIPNSVTMATGKISHTGKSSFLPELQYLQSILPEDQHKNIKLTLTSPSWYHVSSVLSTRTAADRVTPTRPVEALRPFLLLSETRADFATRRS